MLVGFTKPLEIWYLYKWYIKPVSTRFDLSHLVKDLHTTSRPPFSIVEEGLRENVPVVQKDVSDFRGDL